MKRLFWVFVLIVCGLTRVHAGDMDVEVYPLGLSDFDSAETVAKQIVSPDGKLVSDRKGNRLILYDYADNRTALRQALMKVRPPTQNIRIVVSMDGASEATSSGVSVNGKVRVGDVTIQTPGRVEQRGGIDVHHTGAIENSVMLQELLVVSGGEARLRVGQDIPYSDWLWTYGLQQGYWSGNVQWREVGARLVVQPTVVGGDQIRIRLTPEFSYVVDGRNMTTDVEKLTTEVYVANGQEVDLGGLNSTNQEFFSRFLAGYDRLGQGRSLQIRLRSTIEDLGPRPNYE